MLARNLQKYKKLACFIADLTPKLHVWALVLSCQHTNIHMHACMHVYVCVICSCFGFEKPKICYYVFYS